MHLSEFNYFLPQNLIAQTPPKNRSESRLMVLDRSKECIKHVQFGSLLDHLPRDAILVFNNTKVLHARLIGKNTKGKTCECLLIEPLNDTLWYCLLKPARQLRDGEMLTLSPTLKIEIKEKHAKDNLHIVKLHYTGDLHSCLELNGELPLPPYIQGGNLTAKFKDRYQTIFASEPGAIAAPTAGLHFTEALLSRLSETGVTQCQITLHVGYGTFKPIQVDQIHAHTMHEERYCISEETSRILNTAKQNCRPIFAVGTTVARTLESAYQNHQFSATDSGKTSLYITPGYSFQAIDGMITNFHLPQSSLLILVASFASKDFIMNAYHQAIEEQYRFFSFGDAMLIK